MNKNVTIFFNLNYDVDILFCFSLLALLHLRGLLIRGYNKYFFKFEILILDKKFKVMCIYLF